MGTIPKISLQQPNPNASSQQLTPNTYQVKNQKIRRRIIFVLTFILPVIFVLQYPINKQQDIIKEKQIMIDKEKQKLMV